jgi:benzil reductase ((S)-benzoin forming)
MTAFRRMLVWISGASAGLGAALAATLAADAEIVDLSRRGGTPGTHHVAVDLADPASWTVVEEDFSRRLADFDGDTVVFIHNGRDYEQHLIMLSSGASHRPHEGESSYGAGKAAIDQWVRAVGLEQQRRQPGCRVISIAPGAIDTAMQAELRATSDAVFPEAHRFRELEAEGGLAKPEDVARTIWSLLDRDVPNGSVLHVRDLS